MAMLRSILLWLLVSLGLARQPDFTVTIVRDHPDDGAMKPGRVYIVTSGAHMKWAYFLCPADPTEVIQLSLMTSRRPHWRLTRDWADRPTIHPSVWQTAGSHAHFWIRGGVVEWCEDSGKSAAQPR
ncbi:MULTISPECIES: DUF6527 family protein [unclassified Mesorhizobium]|uniref:DUF6527 family protein n=1 Tax=unclassified Mesorhizobium TaxID=325217 RepID=UPI003336140F